MTFFDFFEAQPPALIRQALDDMQAMLESTHDMYVAASAYLLDGQPLALDLEAKDEQVNEKEQAVRRAILEHVAIDPGQEIVFSLTLISIVQDAERIGDLAKTLAEVKDLARGSFSEANVEQVRAIRDRVAAMFERTRLAFLDGDAEEARAVMDASREAKDRVATFLNDLAGQAEVTANEALVLGIAARVIGRSGSHLSNIASSVTLPFHQIRRHDESI